VYLSMYVRARVNNPSPLPSPYFPPLPSMLDIYICVHICVCVKIRATALYACEMQCVQVVGSVEDAVKGAHAIVVMTEWEEFKHIDFAQLKSSMIPPFRVFDGRGVINADNARQAGFEVYMLGRPAVTK